jgi:NAD(P)-dependent dehydrogenase (short-subunit alcohol dehydrogenase family)
MKQPLRNRIALVAGATRGAGRGIACALGEAGATVYCTGRSTKGKPATQGRRETIEETAALVTARGGKGIAVRCDHTNESEVKRLISRIKREQKGKLDILVNDVWGGDALTEWGKTFWQLSLEKGLPMLQNAIHSHIITSRYAVPLMLARDRGLVIEITDGDFFGYRYNLFYDLVKISVIRLAMIMAYELRKTQITALAVTPGFLRSEAMLDLFGVTEENWRDAGKKRPDFLASETPLFVGRAVAALAADPEVKQKSGQVFSSWDLSDEYGFTDADGDQPHWGRHFAEKYGVYKKFDEALYTHFAESPAALVFEGCVETHESAAKPPRTRLRQE